MKMVQYDMIKSGIYGLAVGDALGVPYEFSVPLALKLNPITTMTGEGTWNQPIGTWSDDTGMTLATMGAIIKEKGAVNYDTIMKEFVRWIANGEYTQNIGYEPFDYGGTTVNAITNYIYNGDVTTCGLSGEMNNGNGSLMRILPLAFLNDVSFETVENVSGLTHAHPRSKIACNLYVEIAKQIIEGGEDTFCDYVHNASVKIQEYYQGNHELKYFQRIFDSDYSKGVTGRMHVVDTLETAIYGIKYGEDYKSSLLLAVNQGNDTDTVGAVCGGLAGLYYGYQDIPTEWVDAIYNNEIIDDLILAFQKEI